MKQMLFTYHDNCWQIYKDEHLSVLEIVYFLEQCSLQNYTPKI